MESHESLQVGNKRFHDVKLDFVGVQEIRWNEGGNESTCIYTFLCSKRNAVYYFGTFHTQRDQMMIELVVDRMLHDYIIVKV